MTLEQGKPYRVKLTSGKWVEAVFLEANDHGGYKTSGGPFTAPRTIRRTTRYHFRNVASGRTITLRSMRKVKESGGGL